MMQRWEYLTVRGDVTGFNNNTLAPHIVNGQELNNWKKFPSMISLADLGPMVGKWQERLVFTALIIIFCTSNGLDPNTNLILAITALHAPHCKRSLLP